MGIICEGLKKEDIDVILYSVRKIFFIFLKILSACISKESLKRDVFKSPCRSEKCSVRKLESGILDSGRVYIPKLCWRRVNQSFGGRISIHVH